MAYKDSKQYIKGVSAFNGGTIQTNNSPTQYADRQKRYMAGRSSMFDANRAYLSADYFEAEVQGIEENFYEWTKTCIRLSDISSLGGATSTKKQDDYKEILLPEIDIDYFPIGAKVKTMGNTWICVNPSNISSAKTKAVVARCNASYNSYDYYGNIVTEPIIVEKYAMAGNDNERKNTIVLMDGYFNVTCQLNGNTEQLKENSRIILGRKPYQITGVTDFIQEFTGERDSCHLLTFTARVEEPNATDDITRHFIAGGNAYEFDCIIQATDNISVGETIPFVAHFIKNDEIVDSTEEYPVTWLWESNNESVAEVDELGNVTAKSIGNTRITARMVQNSSISVSCELTVVENGNNGKRVVFTSIPPKELSQYESVVISAVYKENGKIVEQPLEWIFEGADSENDYSYVVAENGMSVEITCISPSENNLEVTARCNGVETTATIELVGY